MRGVPGNRYPYRDNYLFPIKYSSFHPEAAHITYNELTRISHKKSMLFSKTSLKKRTAFGGNIEYRTRNSECRRKEPFGQINACGGGSTASSAHFLSIFDLHIFILFLSFFILFFSLPSTFDIPCSIFDILFFFIMYNMLVDNFW